MHYHYHTLQQLSHYLNAHHSGELLVECFSQSRNELIMAFEHICIRVGCNTPHTYVVPVDAFAKAKKNVVNLFEEATRLPMEQTYVVAHERELIIRMADGYEFILKMHGTMANVLLRKGGEIIGLFNQKIETDWEYEEVAGKFDETALSQESPASKRKVMEALRAMSPIYDKWFGRRIWQQMESGMGWPEAFRSTEKEAANEQFFILKEKDRIRLLLFEPEEGVYVPVEGIRDALGTWMRCQFQYQHYRTQHKYVSRILKQPLDKFQKVYDSYADNVTNLESQRDPEEIGHLLMANLHAIPPDSETVTLQDFYTEGEITLKINPKLSPQDNAKRYYDRHKQRKAQLAYLKEQLEDLGEKVLEAEEAWEEFQELVPPDQLAFSRKGFDLPAIKALKEVARKFQKEQKQEEASRYPFRTFEKQGYQIFVGRNARNNDELSFKYAHKNDLWLHAKDVSGSHVVIRQRPGKEVPPAVLEFAAQLAAYYSKRKNDTLVPVLFTPKKYIRKRKGDPPGLVAVDREEVIMVEPIRE